MHKHPTGPARAHRPRAQLPGRAPRACCRAPAAPACPPAPRASCAQRPHARAARACCLPPARPPACLPARPNACPPARPACYRAPTCAPARLHAQRPAPLPRACCLAQRRVATRLPVLRHRQPCLLPLFLTIQFLYCDTNSQQPPPSSTIQNTLLQYNFMLSSLLQYKSCKTILAYTSPQSQYKILYCNTNSPQISFLSAIQFLALQYNWAVAQIQFSAKFFLFFFVFHYN